MTRLQRERRRSIGRLDDDALGRAAARGDEQAFAELTARNRDWLVDLCRRHLRGDAHRAEDIAQECLVKFHAALQRDHRPLKPRAWLSVVARNACIDLHRTTRAEPTDELTEVGVEAIDPFDVDPILAEAWEALTSRHREVLQHRELMGLAYDEIAIAMDTTVSAIETLLHRARSALRRNYRRAGGELLGCGLFGASFMRLIETGSTSELDAHLTACADCTDAAARLAETTDLLRIGLLPSSAGPDLKTSPLATWTTELGAAMSSLGSGPQALLQALSNSGGVIAAVAAAVAVTGGAIVLAADDPAVPAPPAAATPITDNAPRVAPEPPVATTISSAGPGDFADLSAFLDDEYSHLTPPIRRDSYLDADGSLEPGPWPAPIESEPCPASGPMGGSESDDGRASGTSEPRTASTTTSRPSGPCDPFPSCFSDSACSAEHDGGGLGHPR